VTLRLPGTFPQIYPATVTPTISAPGLGNAMALVLIHGLGIQLSGLLRISYSSG
jgi:hypothetical protein